MNTVSDDFRPSQRIYALAHEREIPTEFVDGCVGEFIFYYTEGKGKGTRRKSWGGTFWNWVKNGWGWKADEEKKTKTTCSVPFREMEKIEKSTSKMSLRERLRHGS